MKATSIFELTIVIPVYNERESLQSLIVSLNNLKSQLPKKTELIFIDDGSTDKSAELLESSDIDFPYQIIIFSRNFGHQAALIAGLEKARGDAVITMDADLQHPPELLPTLYQKFLEGYSVVVTQRIETEGISSFKQNTSNMFYNLMNSISNTKISTGASDFRLLDQKVLQILLSLPEQRKFLRGLIPWIGYPTVVIPYKAHARANGQSKYSLKKMIALAFQGIASFSTAPLYFSVFASVMFSALAFLYGLYVLYVRFITDQVVEGWSSVIFVTLSIGGVLSFLFAITGVYIAAIYEEVKKRPEYLIKMIVNKK